jgi:hypothetical protein
MHPWHLLVCDSKTDLLASAANFVRDRGGQDDVSGPRDLPNRVKRLIELGGQSRAPDRGSYLDDDFWDGESDTPDDLSGLMVVQDLRD